MSSTYETVKVEHENGIAWVILNRPDKRNAMSPQIELGTRIGAYARYGVDSRRCARKVPAKPSRR